MTKAENFLSQNKFAIFSGALSREQCAHYVQHMFELYDQNKLVKDDQCPLSDSIYNDELFVELLHKMAAPIGKMINRELLPTYTYARIYRNGEVLKKHVDRDACEISATITLGYDSKFIWKLFFDEEKQIPVELDVGEMVVYKGREVVHWRPAFKGNWQVQVFLHYVDANGQFKEHYLDGKVNTNNKNKTEKIEKAAQNSLIISPTDDSYPTYLCIDSRNLSDLKFSKSECEKIISITREAYPISASVGGTLENSKIKRNVREAQIYSLDYNKENEWIFNKILSIVAKVNKEYYDFDLAGIKHGIQLIEYSIDEENVRGHYEWHSDTGPGEPSTRKLSVIVQLSDPTTYSGCNLVVNDCGYEIVASNEQGSIHCFPSYMIHKVTPIDKGVRYALVIWIHGTRRFR